MDNQFLMDMVYVGCGVIFGLIVRKLVVTYCTRPWVGLTDEEIDELHGSPMSLEHSGALKWVRIIEAKLKEKNT